ncbi:actin-related protein 8 isoform X2 [Arachis ipaensis]|uniref:actin-related protein 8 isoform X2 n=1 Tax=Arachis ipaensis TaxID=130454 RepID=UPI0007AFD464|nr:actin-related protein 8 isoform X2 [Arachis ipaensis]
MSMVLRRVWELVSSTSRGKVDGSGAEACSRSDLGELEQLPGDILLQILRVLGPKDAAKMSCVCKALRCLVFDNRLWVHFLQTYQPDPSSDSLFFAEATLSYGYPLPLPPFHARTPQLSFKHIYGQRARVPGSVIIDGGSGYCKFGWSKYASPSGRSATFLEFGNIESPMYTRLRHFFATIYNRMQVKPNTQPVIVSVPICHYDDTESAKASRRQLKEAIYSALFDMNVPAVCAVNQATLALFAAKRTSGIAVNIGFQVTSVVPIFNGKVMRSVGVEVVGLGALKLTGFLREKMQLNNLNFQSLYTVRTLKEKLCYVALDYEAELSKDEILFQPHLAGVQAMGLHQAIALCMEHCHSAELAGDSDWYKTVVLSGGSACLPGLAERLEKELKALLPPYISNGTRVIPPPYGADTPWFGAKIIGNLSTFPGPWCVTKKQFRQKPRLNLIW